MELKVDKKSYFKKKQIPAQIPKLSDEKKILVDSMIKKIDELLEK